MKQLRNVTIPLRMAQKLDAVAARELSVPVDQVRSVRVTRRSIDARGKAPRLVLSMDVALETDDALPPVDLDSQLTTPDIADPSRKVVIVGTGPAGLFAALRCTDLGVPCTIIDRGGRLEERHKRARLLRSERQLDAESNLCFGEGGAGTYSDGKLYTRKKSPWVREVYRRLVEFGASPDILVDAHPHVGTNRLIPIMEQMREYLLTRGCDFRFDTRMDALHVENGKIRGIVTTGGDIDADALVLATGHSARDTYAMLADAGVPMESKPFAIGARVEHPQHIIDAIQFGGAAGHPVLGAAEYFLKCQVDDRGVYSFCMCPGGFVIPTPTEHGHLNVNGMSNSTRKNFFANAALVVTLDPKDFAPSGNPLEGLDFQRRIEKLSFDVGGGDYTAPAARLTDFVAGRGSSTLPNRTSYRPSLSAANLHSILPDYVTDAIQHALRRFNRQLRGYLTEEAVIIASETTTSSPIRIIRDESLQSPAILGLYPTGEGAGYAGGIVSSAMDGIRVMDHVVSQR